MSRLKILHYPLEFRTRGAEIYTVEHWRFLDRKRFVFDFVSLHDSIALEPILQEDGARVILIPAAYREGHALISHMEQILRAGQYDVMHIHLRYWTPRDAAILALAVHAGVPSIILHAHGADIDDARRTVHEQVRDSLALTPQVVLCAYSQRAGTFMFGMAAREHQVQILKNAIDLTRFSCAEPIWKENRDYYEANKPCKQTWALTVAAADLRQIDLNFVMETIRLWAQRDELAWWAYCGNGPDYKDEWNACLKILPKIGYFMNEQWIVQKYMHVHDCLLHPTRLAGTSRVLIEAQAAGMPCLVSEISAEDVPHSALLHTLPLSAPASEWAEKLEQLVQNPPQDRTCALPLLKREGFDVRDAVKLLENLYEMRKADVSQ